MFIPEGWVEIKIGDMAQYINGKAFKPSEWEDSGLKIVRIQNLNDNNAKYNYSSKTFEEKYKIKKDDLLFAWSASLGAYIWHGKDAWLNQHIFKVIPYDGIDKDFLYYVLVNTASLFYSKTHGSGMVHITKEPFESTKAFLPPFLEQQRIVTKIDLLFSELDNGVTLLKTIKAQLEVYRQAVLKWAFEGKEHFVSFGEITESRLGKMLDTNKNKGKFKPYLRNINVRWFDFNLDDLLEMKFEKDEDEKYSAKKGDLIICEGGEPGRCAIWKLDEPIKYQKALHRVRPKDDWQTEYLMYYIRYITNTGHINNYFTGTGIKHLTGESLKKIPVPICSTSEQQAIVSAIESRLSVCDKLEQTIDQTLALSASLRQSILKKAFEGRLVPQDPNDEPAEKLLERIKAEKAAVLAKQKQTRKRKRK